MRWIMNNSDVDTYTSLEDTSKILMNFISFSI